jgi:hypothetical protein
MISLTSQHGRGIAKIRAERTVDPLSVVVHDLLDQTHVLQSPHGLSGQRTVDLHSLDEDRLGDHLVGRDLLEDLVAVNKKRQYC